MSWSNILKNPSRKILTVQILINYMKSRRNMYAARDNSLPWGRSTKKSHSSLSQSFSMGLTILISCWVQSRKLQKSWIKTPLYWAMSSMKKSLEKWGRIHSKYMKSREIINCKRLRKKQSYLLRTLFCISKTNSYLSKSKIKKHSSESFKTNYPWLSSIEKLPLSM